MNVENLKKLMSLGLTTEQMAGVIDVLAVELAPLEAMRADAESRRSKDRLRKFRGNSMETPVEIPVQSPTPPIDITTTLVLEKLPPTPKASRFHGTNPVRSALIHAARSKNLKASMPFGMPTPSVRATATARAQSRHSGLPCNGLVMRRR